MATSNNKDKVLKSSPNKEDPRPLKEETGCHTNNQLIQLAISYIIAQEIMKIFIIPELKKELKKIKSKRIKEKTK